MAVGQGFEPWELLTLNGFQDRRFRPLSHPTRRRANYTSLFNMYKLFFIKKVHFFVRKKAIVFKMIMMILTHSM